MARKTSPASASKKRKSLSDDSGDSDFDPSVVDNEETETEESEPESESSSSSDDDVSLKQGKGKGKGKAAAKRGSSGRGRGRGRRSGGGGGGGGGGGDEGDGGGGGGGGEGKKKGKPGAPEITYKVEVAERGLATCRKCDTKCLKDEIRIGVEMNSGRFGITIRWQHLGCTIFAKTLKTVDDIEGFEYLEAAQQAEVRARFEASQHEVDEDTQPIDPSELVRKEWTTQMEPPASLVLPALPYQKEGLGWMYNQEHTPYHGGILADEMGMGKTIQAIALLLANRASDAKHSAEWSKQEADHGRTPNPKRRAGTLVVCPLIALLQWQSEIARFTAEKSLKVLIYHGSNRDGVKAALQEADVVLTTYSIVEAEYRKMTSPEKVRCEDCGKRFYPDKLRLHKRYFCGEGAALTAAQARTQRKGRAVAVGNQSKRDRRAQGVAIEEDEDEDEDAEATLSDSDSDSDSDSSEDDGPKKKKGRLSAAASAKAKGKGKKAAAEGEGDKYAQIKARNKRLMAEAMAGSKQGSGGGSKQGGGGGSKQGAAGKGAKKGRVIEVSSGGSSSSSSSSSSSEEDEEAAKYARIKAANKRKMEEMASKDKDKGKSKSKSSRGGRGGGRGGQAGNKSARGRSSRGGGGRGRGSRKSKGSDSSDEDFVVTISSDSSSESESSSEDEDETEDEALPRKAKAAERSVIHDLSWFRIILDEAHYIKTRSTSTAKAVFALTSLNKWCLTGTPLQNRVGELYSLVRFLRMNPHAYYFCRRKGCECKSLHYRFGANWDSCVECGHTPMFHFSYFNRTILNPIQRAGYIGEGRKAMLTLKNEILDPLLLRRTKDTRAADIMLPPRLVRVRALPLDEREADFYESLYTQSQAQFDTYLQSGTVLNNYAHIFDILIRLRQAVDHPYLVIHSHSRTNTGAGMGTAGPPQAKGNAESESDGTDEDDEEECVLCHEEIEDAVRAECGCGFCRLCVREYIESSVGGQGAVNSCPKCAKPLTVDLSSKKEEEAGEAEEQPAGNGNDKRRRTSSSAAAAAAASASNRAGTLVCVGGKVKLQGLDRKSILHRIQLENFQSSTKLEALLEELHVMQARDPSAKAIVFSQFVNMLDLILWRLTAEGVKCAKLSGHMSVTARDTALRAFKENPDVKVLLISLKAGGVALNLTHANHIFLMDPWWNPAAEMQAIDRTHRIGQYKPIFATRFIIEGSIEERILRLQEKKQLVFDSTVGGDAGALGRLTVDDLRFLFTQT